MQPTMFGMASDYGQSNGMTSSHRLNPADRSNDLALNKFDA